MADFNVNGTDYSLTTLERFENEDLWHFEGRRSDTPEGVWFGIQVSTDLTGEALEVRRYAYTPDAGLNVWKVTVSPASPDLVLAVAFAEDFATVTDVPSWVDVADFSVDRSYSVLLGV